MLTFGHTWFSMFFFLRSPRLGFCCCLLLHSSTHRYTEKEVFFFYLGIFPVPMGSPLMRAPADGKRKQARAAVSLFYFRTSPHAHGDTTLLCIYDFCFLFYIYISLYTIFLLQEFTASSVCFFFLKRTLHTHRFI